MAEDQVSQKGLAGKALYVILIVAVMLVLVLVVLYIVAIIRKNKLESVELHDKIIPLNNGEIVPFNVSNGVMALPHVGGEFSYTFWLYLSEKYETTFDHKLLFQRGNRSINKNEVSRETNPIVFLDKGTNRLYIAIATNLVVKPMTLDQVIEKSVDGKYTSGYMVGYIDYLPLQRWVNVSFVIKDDKMFIFMDGDMYTAVSVSDIKTTSSKRAVISYTDGDAQIGSPNIYRIDGYASFTRFFNYALTNDDVQSIYKTGPNKKSILSYLGLNNYGLRTPIYNLDDEAKANTK